MKYFILIFILLFSININAMENSFDKQIKTYELDNGLKVYY